MCFLFSSCQLIYLTETITVQSVFFSFGVKVSYNSFKVEIIKMG